MRGAFRRQWPRSRSKKRAAGVQRPLKLRVYRVAGRQVSFKSARNNRLRPFSSIRPLAKKSLFQRRKIYQKLYFLANRNLIKSFLLILHKKHFQARKRSFLANKKVIFSIFVSNLRQNRLFNASPKSIPFGEAFARSIPSGNILIKGHRKTLFLRFNKAIPSQNGRLTETEPREKRQKDRRKTTFITK